MTVERCTTSFNLNVKNGLIWGYYPSRMNLSVYLHMFYLEKGDYNEKTLKEIMKMKMGGVAMHHG